MEILPGPLELEHLSGREDVLVYSLITLGRRAILSEPSCGVDCLVPVFRFVLGLHTSFSTQIFRSDGRAQQVISLALAGPEEESESADDHQEEAELRK